MRSRRPRPPSTGPAPVRPDVATDPKEPDARLRVILAAIPRPWYSLRFRRSHAAVPTVRCLDYDGSEGVLDMKLHPLVVLWIPLLGACTETAGTPTQSAHPRAALA